MRLTPGTRLGPFEVVTSIGAGGMGEVYRARDTRLDRDVAIKLLPAEFVSSRDRMARFDREARTVAGLAHPNIVVLHSIEEHDGTRFLVLELVEGRDLTAIIVPGGPNRAMALNDFGAVLAGRQNDANDNIYSYNLPGAGHRGD